MPKAPRRAIHNRSSGPIARPDNKRDIEAVLAAGDPELGRLIDAVILRIGLIRPKPSRASSFEALLRAIVYQQMTDAAAARIFRSLVSLVPSRLTPQRLLAQPLERLREAGLSGTKARYARSLAEWFTVNPERAKNLPSLSNDEIVSTLTRIPGVGVWTVNVFLIFSLNRLDVVPASDLGIRRGVQLAYGLQAPATAEFVAEKARRWQPYQSIASMYLWNAVKLKISPEMLR